MDMRELPEYIRAVKELQERYHDQIDIYIGLEIENYQAFQKELREYREMFDYCIIGQHSTALRDGAAIGDIMWKTMMGMSCCMPDRSKRRWKQEWQTSSLIQICSCMGARSGTMPVSRLPR